MGVVCYFCYEFLVDVVLFFLCGFGECGVFLWIEYVGWFVVF